VLPYLHFLILLPALVGVIRYKRLDDTFFPFLVLLWVGCLNEILSEVLVYYRYPTIGNANIYVLIEGLCILAFFKRQALFDSGSRLYTFLTLFLLLFWVGETLLFASITSLSLYFRIVCSFVIVLLSIQQVNKLLTSTHTPLLTHSLFLICISFIIYFTYKILVYTFWLYGLKKSAAFVMSIYTIMIYINLFCNLIYTIATLWMPRKLPSLLPS
jgi:hypothetical protein